MTSPDGTPHFAQVAISTPDMPASVRFYHELLGHQLAGGRYAAGAGLAAVQGLDDPACICWWLVNGSPYFQMELFQYVSPVPGQRAPDWRPCDIGYTRLGFAVKDAAGAVAAADAVGTPVLLAEEGAATVLDPAGIPVDLEEDEANDGRARLVSVAASVPDLGRARRFFSETLGMAPASPPAKGFATDEPWGLETAERDSLALDCGGVRVELHEYRSPQGQPRRPGWQLNDHGVLNIALGFRDWDEFNAAYEHVIAGGYHAQTAPMGRGGAFDVSYCMDDDGFSVELLYCPESSDAMLGFVPEGPGPRR